MTQWWYSATDTVGLFPAVYSESEGIKISEYKEASKKRWNTAICDNMDRSWEYNVKQNNSDRKSQEPYDFTNMWDMKPTNKQKLIDTANSMVVSRGKEDGEDKNG